MATQPVRARSRRMPIIPVLLFLFLCLAGVTAAFGVALIPRLAETVYGPAASTLHPGQRILISARLLLAREAMTRPGPAAGEPLPFTIELGESPASIAYRLEQAGLIADAGLFQQYLVYSGIDRRVQAGSYMLEPGLPPVEIAHQLQDATPGEVKFYVLPGWRLEEIAAALPTSGLELDPEAFLRLAKNVPEVWKPAGWPDISSLEGYILPGEYIFSRESEVEDLLKAFMARFDEVVTTEMRAAFQANGLTLTQAVTLASIVEKEGVREEERPQIASVFYNRLRSGMKLDSDPTVQYAVGYNQEQGTWWTNPLSGEHLNLDSPYNTYRYPGLPPGPIASPSLASLNAVAHPAETTYYFFRADCDGSGWHQFAETYDQHLQYGCD